MRDQLPLLVRLQQLDNRIRILTDEQQQLPQQLQPYEVAGCEAREALAVLQGDLEQAERQRRALERDLDGDQARQARTQGRLHAIKTNKEYSAVLAEIEMGKQRISALEDQVLDLMEFAEQQRQASQEYDRRVQEAVKTLEEQSNKIEQTSQALAQQITTNEAERQRIVVQLDADLYATYQKIIAQRDGLAVVQIYDDTCGGCHLMVRPQLLSDIRRQETLVQCPHCQRVLLWPT